MYQELEARIAIVVQYMVFSLHKRVLKMTTACKNMYGRARSRHNLALLYPQIYSLTKCSISIGYIQKTVLIGVHYFKICIYLLILFVTYNFAPRYDSSKA